MAAEEPSSSGDDPIRRTRPGTPGTRELFDALATGDPEDHLRLEDILAGLSRQVFGMLLFVATLPAFIPIPGVGGAIGGPLTVLVGVHLLVGMRKLWLPRFVARRGPRRASLQAFQRMLGPWLGRLERLVRPRMTGMIDRRAASMFTGLLLVLLGILLALPIPFTNYLFGGLLLLYAFALLERDGLLMLLCWIAGIVAIVVFGVASGALAAAATRWIGGLFA
ncbi:exopolysaccharide biosynthesis protein [Luteimonas marina]|uniref:Exopolysaccharide biosynthesis protein n=1 Tax=Luteimonas marina TaxID=488485 RepID=A0A5C5TTT3_9GAMM|nr:exopolysaccharide biosynthesis protein [Luteimonas marina]TWT17603.1 exopolysaccharide biosynthesis protein [Luteimonas marina]